MLKKILAVSLVVVLTAMMFGCVLIGAGIGGAIGEGMKASELPGTVEVGEVKMKAGADVATLKTAKLSSAVFEKDMTTRNTSPDPNNTKVNTAVTEEVKHSLGIPGNAASPVTVRLKTYFGEINPWGWSSWYYGKVTERETLSYGQIMIVEKLVNAHFVLEQGSDTLLEVHGLWVSDNQGDEIAGASKLAKEIVTEVLKKLSVTSAPPRESVAEAETKKE